jgi:hypothetical protein
MDLDPDVCVGDRDGNAGVDADPDTDLGAGTPRLARERELGFGGRSNRGIRVREGHRERITLRRQLAAAMFLPYGAEQLVMARKQRGKSVSEVEGEASAALDVAEQERDGRVRHVAFGRSGTGR